MDTFLVKVLSGTWLTTFVVHDDMERPIAGAFLNLDTGLLSNLWVAEGYRRHGLAATIMRAAEKEVSGRGLEMLIVATHPLNVPAQKLFEKLGYKLMYQYSKQMEYINA